MSTPAATVQTDQACWRTWQSDTGRRYACCCHKQGDASGVTVYADSPEALRAQIDAEERLWRAAA